MGLAFALGGHELFTLESIVAQRDRFHGFLAQHGMLALLTYVLIYAIAVALSIPCGLILTVAGGLLFGWLTGALAAMVGATFGATVVFLVARSAMGDSTDERIGPWIGKLREGFKQEALSYMLFLRLVPAFPFWFVNIAPALLGVPLRTYVVGTILGIIPATFALASAGAGLDSVVIAAKKAHAACAAHKGAEACEMQLHASSLLTKELMLALVLLGVVALIPIVLKKWRRTHAAIE
jgi:uncharacterized membrane protein YdjX (TVP38/TMEM64 family)